MCAHPARTRRHRITLRPARACAASWRSSPPRFCVRLEHALSSWNEIAVIIPEAVKDAYLRPRGRCSPRPTQHRGGSARSVVPAASPRRCCDVELPFGAFHPARALAPLHPPRRHRPLPQARPAEWLRLAEELGIVGTGRPRRSRRRASRARRAQLGPGHPPGGAGACSSISRPPGAAPPWCGQEYLPSSPHPTSDNWRCSFSSARAVTYRGCPLRRGGPAARAAACRLVRLCAASARAYLLPDGSEDEALLAPADRARGHRGLAARRDPHRLSRGGRSAAAGRAASSGGRGQYPGPRGDGDSSCGHARGAPSGGLRGRSRRAGVPGQQPPLRARPARGRAHAGET